MSQIPDLKEELNRKVMESVSWLMSSVQSGQITDFQFSTGIDALFMAVAGLVGKDFVEIVTEAQKLSPDGQNVQRRYFYDATTTDTVRVVWRPGSDHITRCAIAGGSVYEELVTEFANPTEAHSALLNYKESGLVEM
jgi:hypothetical protein